MSIAKAMENPIEQSYQEVPYEEYAIRAFEVNSIDYLLKPVKQDKLAKSIEKYKRQQNDGQFVDIASLMRSFTGETEEKKEYQQRFLVSAGDKLRSIPIKEVAFFYGQKRYVFLITNDRITAEFSILSDMINLVSSCNQCNNQWFFRL